MKELSLFLLILFAACGDDDYGNANPQQEQEEEETPASKSLFSQWRRNDGLILDLRNADFNRSLPFSFPINLGSSCRCTIRIAGTENSGTFNLTGCSWRSDGPGDPGCFQQIGTNTFRKNGNVLNWDCRVSDVPASCGNYN